MRTHNIILPFTKESAAAIRAGDTVYLTGSLYTARDAAHKRFTEALEKGDALPVPLRDETIYYVGPTPAKPGRLIGAAGPTTSARMDAYTPQLLKEGLRAMIGKGKRAPHVIEAIREAGAVYLGAIGGAGALLAACVTAYEIVAYHDLSPEAVYRLTVKDFPTVAIADAHGGNVYAHL